MATRGRRRIYEYVMDVYNVRLNANQARKARRLGDDNMGEGVRRALDLMPWPECTAKVEPKLEVVDHD